MEQLPEKFLLIDKPVDWTSFDAVNFVRSYARTKTGNKNIHPVKSGEAGLSRPGGTKFNRVKVGHAGTLDPFATGLLIVGVGREATKKLDEFKSLPKTYLATVRLGATSTTEDSTGQISSYHCEERSDEAIPSEKEILNILKSFLGPQKQIPPMYSAKKINGQKMYSLARAGKIVEREPSDIEIYDLKFLAYNWPNLEIEVSCSAGTYIRTLAKDIGEKLQTGAYCAELRRTKIGPYNVEEAIKINKDKQFDKEPIL
jgi:tRNA pseudouridine55 synthase